MSYFIFEFKRSLISLKTLLAIIITFISLLVGGFEYIFDNSFNIGYIYLFKYAYSDGTISILAFTAPIIACIPFATSYIIEKESNLTNYIYVKISSIKYILIKFFLNLFLGGFVLFSGTVLFVLFIMILKGYNPSDSITLNHSLEYIYYFNPLIYILIEISLLYVFGMVISTICLVISNFFKNKYFAIVCTFFIYMLIGITTSGYLPYLNIQNLYDLSLNGDINIFYRLIYALFILIISLLILLKKFSSKENRFE